MKRKRDSFVWLKFPGKLYVRANDFFKKKSEKTKELKGVGCVRRTGRFDAELLSRRTRTEFGRGAASGDSETDAAAAYRRRPNSAGPSSSYFPPRRVVCHVAEYLTGR